MNIMHAICCVPPWIVTYAGDEFFGVDELVVEDGIEHG